MAVEAPPAEALDPVAAGARPMGGAVALMSLPAEVLSHLLGQLPTTDLLACACVASALRRAATQILNETKALRLRGTATSATQLERLLCKRMRGTTQELDVCACPKISKAHVVMSVRNSQMALLHARDVGKGSWTVRALEQLLSAAPLTLRRGAIEIDCRIAINIDVPAACAVLALPMLRVRRLVIISDYSAGRVGAAAGAAAAELELPGPAVPGAAVPGAAALGPGLAADAADEFDGLARLSELLSSKADLQTLDCSSGSLGVAGVSGLVTPFLRAPGCALEYLACSAVPRECVADLISALGVNRSLRTLRLGCNSLYPASAAMLATAIASHPRLEALEVEHNVTLDEGGAALVSACEHSLLRRLSVAFTGAADRTAGALANVVRRGRPLAAINLCGNGVGTDGVRTIAKAMEDAGKQGALRTLCLSCNHRIDAAAVMRLAQALPSCALRRLELSGCHVSARAASALARALRATELVHLDLSANPLVGDEGCWSLAWALAEGSSLRELVLSSCELTDDGATELLDALRADDDGHAASGLRTLDVRGNKIDPHHPLVRDERVSSGFQRPADIEARS
jgi:hypothetical protein